MRFRPTCRPARLFRCAVAAAVLSAWQAASSPALAQQPAAPAAAHHYVVLLAEMTGDPAVDAHLRAATDAIVQRLRSKGYELAPPQAVGIAMQRGIREPQALRSAVGAELALRTNVVSRDPSRVVVHVEVYASLGQRGQDVAGAPAAIPTDVPAAADLLMPPPGTSTAPAPTIVAPVPAPAPVPKYPAPAPTVPAPATPYPAPAYPVAPAQALDRVVLKDGTVVEGKVLHQAPGSYVVLQTPDGRQRTLSWDQVRDVLTATPAAMPQQPHQLPGTPPPLPQKDQKTWDARGGAKFTFDVSAQIVGLLQRINTTVNKTFTSDEKMTFTGSSDAGGGGGGAMITAGLLYLKAPAFQLGTTPESSPAATWTGFRMGAGFGISGIGYWHRTNADIQTGLRDANNNIIRQGSAVGGETQGTASRVIMLPLFIGGQFGFGSFRTDSFWRGTMLGIDWMPTYFHSKPGDLSATDGFNPAGFRLTVDVGSLEADKARDANFRLSLMLLPPVSNRPTILAIGFGAVWY